MRLRRVAWSVGAVIALWCSTAALAVAQLPDARRPEKIRPGISVLLDERIGLIQGRRVAIVTNQTGVDEHGNLDIDLLRTDSRARKARVQLVALFSPEHGIRGTEDREFVEGGVDAKSGLVVHSLYAAQTIPPPDSLLRGVQAIIVDLQDIGTRTWTFTGLMLYTLRAGARNRIPVLVLDRPNPITGTHFEGPLLDSAIANPNDPAPGAPGKAYALYPVPLRHGMTMGEMAQLFNAKLAIGADLTVVPVKGWHREQWFDQTGLPWVRPSPNMPSIASALLYPGLVAFEASNLSVGRGTDIAFQHVGAPWLRAKDVVDLLADRLMPGVKFEAERFTPQSPTDGKFPGQSVAGVRIVVTDRERANPSRIGAALLWAIAKTSGDSLRLRDGAFDDRFGASRVREALLRGEDPDAVLDRELPASIAFREAVKPYLIYR
ncbi:MAG: exo-beta-N-acetylmuramidase NamZ domain-containing protein [Gemmatimonadales bacterium]